MYKLVFITAFFTCGLIVANMVSQDAPLISQTGTNQQEQEKDKPKKRIVIPADDDKSNERKDFMRIKLQSSQYILEGLSINNFDLVDKGIQQIKEMTKSGKWVSIDDKFYRELVRDFETATERLEEAAKTKNIDATALRYYQLTTNCIDCHKHIRSAAYEF